jgi:leucyl aminopeptidase
MTLITEVVAASPEGHATPLLAVLAGEGRTLPTSLQALDRQAGGALSRLYAAGGFSGKRDETALAWPPGAAERVLLVGIGKDGPDPRGSLRRGAAVAAKQARKARVESMSIVVASGATTLGAADVAQLLAEGIPQGAWRFDAMKLPPEEPRPELAAARLLVASDVDAARAGHRVGSSLAAGHVLARDLQVLPGNVCTPAHIASVASDLAGRHGFKVTVFDRKALESEGMRALLAVAQGGGEEPRFIVLEYEGSQDAPVVLVGKGITFDTGGISIKPADKMEDMKFDMSGAAAVLGAFEAIGRLKPSVHVIGLIPSCENMPSGSAYKPGDVVKSHLGKTIEVVNTDAEGRVILCDALSYARRFKPACVIDAATLTGAVVIALGHTAAGVLGNDDPLIAEIRNAAGRSGERVWQLPLWDDYRDLIKSDIADMKNSGGRAAGTITGAWFLREFTEDYPWAHLDIAGTAYIDRESPAMVKGPTGMATRLFAEFVLARG